MIAELIGMNTSSLSSSLLAFGVPVILAIITIAGALIALNARDLLRGVLGIGILFIGIAGFFGYLDQWFLAFGQLFLFVGGVVTLFVLAFNMERTPRHVARSKHSLLLWIVLPLVIFLTLASFLDENAITTSSMNVAGSHADIGVVLFTQYGWVISVALLLLFSAIIGANYLLEDVA